jgi:hypothetical protein
LLLDRKSILRYFITSHLEIYLRFSSRECGDEPREKSMKNGCFAFLLYLSMLGGCAHSSPPSSNSSTTEGRQSLDRDQFVWIKGGQLMVRFGDARSTEEACVSVPADAKHHLAEGKACLTRSLSRIALMQSLARDGYLIHIDPSQVEPGIKRLYIHGLPAGEVANLANGACEWTRKHPTCSFTVPADWGMGFVITIDTDEDPHGRDRFWTGDIQVSLNGRLAEIQTTLIRGPSRARLYTLKERPVHIDGDTLKGAMPLEKEFTRD